MKEDDFKYLTIKAYDPKIWKDYNAIEPLEEMKRFKASLNKKILFIVFKQKPQQNKNFVVVFFIITKVALKLLATKELIVIFQELSAPMFSLFIPSNGSITLAVHLLSRWLKILLFLFHFANSAGSSSVTQPVPQHS
jgi:hypothetical protein